MIKLRFCFFEFLFLFHSLAFAQDTEEAIDCTKTIWGGPSGPNVKCVFPFKAQGRTFTECTTHSERNKRPWCATKVNERGEHLLTSNDWGYCDRKCPFTDGSGTHNEATTKNPNEKFSPPTTKRPITARRPTKQSGTPKPSTTAEQPLNIELVKNNETLSGTWLPKSDSLDCGVDTSSGFVTGGQDAKRGQFPFAALLGYEDLKQRSASGIVYLCGGTLINRRYVVTAAHCHEAGLVGFEILEVVLGEHDVATDPDCDTCVPKQKFRPENVLLHEQWTTVNNKGNVPDFDIALVRLDRWATLIIDDFASMVLPVCLEPPAVTTLETKVIVIGWGQIKSKGQPNSNPEEDHLERYGVGHRTLQKLSVPLVSNEKCNTFFPGISEGHICAGGVPGQDSCNGDSGGGLVTEAQPMFLVGVVSSGSRICGVGEPGIYTRVEKMLPWIKSNLLP